MPFPSLLPKPGFGPPGVVRALAASALLAPAAHAQYVPYSQNFDSFAAGDKAIRNLPGSANYNYAVQNNSNW